MVLALRQTQKVLVIRQTQKVLAFRQPQKNVRLELDWIELQINITVTYLATQ